MGQSATELPPEAQNQSVPQGLDASVSADTITAQEDKRRKELLARMLMSHVNSQTNQSGGGAGAVIAKALQGYMIGKYGTADNQNAVPQNNINNSLAL
jgi:hypothetical protein